MIHFNSEPSLLPAVTAHNFSQKYDFLTKQGHHFFEGPALFLFSEKKYLAEEHFYH